MNPLELCAYCKWRAHFQLPDACCAEQSYLTTNIILSDACCIVYNLSSPIQTPVLLLDNLQWTTTRTNHMNRGSTKKMPRAMAMSYFSTWMLSLEIPPRLNPQLQMGKYWTLNGLPRQLLMRLSRPTPSLCSRIAVEISEATNVCATSMPHQGRWTQIWVYHYIL